MKIIGDGENITKLMTACLNSLNTTKNLGIDLIDVTTEKDRYIWGFSLKNGGGIHVPTLYADFINAIPENSKYINDATSINFNMLDAQAQLEVGKVIVKNIGETIKDKI